MDVKFFRLPEVVQLTGLRPSTVYKLIRLNQFPRGIKLSQRSTGWDSRAVDQWINSKLAAKNSSSKPTQSTKG